MKNITFKKLFLSAFLGNILIWQSAFACDLCAIYMALGTEEMKSGDVSLGFTEQYTDYRGTAKSVLGSSPEQELKSSILQLNGNYQATESVSFQLTLPYIYRDYKRLEDGHLKSGDESGFGDVTILGRYQLVHFKENDTIVNWFVYGGIKLPTGDDDRLKEESSGHHHDEQHGEDQETHEDDHAHDMHSGGEPLESVLDVHHEDDTDHHHSVRLLHGTDAGESLVHGDHLALGTGSVDFPIGTALFLEKGRLFFRGDLQLQLRTEGGHEYQYGNGLYFDAGPGAYIYLDQSFTSSLRFKISGDFKDKDRLNNSSLKGSDQNVVYLGPELLMTASERFAARLGVDFAVHDDNGQHGVEPEYRLILGMSYRL